MLGFVKARRDQKGETLVEILVSTTLLGIVGIGIIGAIASVLISTEIDRKVSQAETVIRSYASAIQRADYIPCGSGAAYTAAADFTPPPRFQATISDVGYWDGEAPVVVPAADPAPRQTSTLNFGACAPGSDHGLQQVSLAVAAVVSGRPDSSGRAELTVFKRDPAARAPATSGP